MIKTFADTSAVSIAYAMSDAADSTEFAGAEMNLIPFTSEGFSMEKEAKMSTAITANRRVTGSKNTKGSASGSLSLEFGAAPFCFDMLSALLMNDWEEEAITLVKTITDGDVMQYMTVEKTVRPEIGAAKLQSLEQYYGTLINDGNLEFGDGELITLALNTMSANATYGEEAQSSDGLGGSIATAKNVPDAYEIADSSNNVKSIVIKDELGSPMELVFSTASLSIENNVRQQAAVGHVFSAGMGRGKVGVTLTGEIYYFDQTTLKAHMENKKLSAEMKIETDAGTFDITLPRLSIQSPTANADSENSDYTASITLTAEEGTVETEKCAIHIKFTPV